MFKLFILFILFINSCNDNDGCVFSEKEMIKALKVFYNKSILEEYQTDLFLDITENNKIHIPDSLKINDKIVHIRSQKEKIPKVFITKIISNQGKFTIVFSIYNIYEYHGDIIFECIDNKLEYRDIHYYSAIE